MYLAYSPNLPTRTYMGLLAGVCRVTLLYAARSLESLTGHKFKIYQRRTTGSIQLVGARRTNWHPCWNVSRAWVQWRVNTEQCGGSGSHRNFPWLRYICIRSIFMFSFGLLEQED